MVRSIASFLLIGFWATSFGVAADQPRPKVEPNRVGEIETRIRGVDDNLSRLQSQLGSMRRDSSNLAEEITRLELERAVLSGKVERFELELEQTDQQIANTRQARTGLEEKAAEQKQRIHLRLRQLYKRGNLGYAQLFLKESRREELITAYHYAKILTERDNRLLTEYLETQRRLADMETQLETFQTQALSTKTQLDEERRELERLLRKRNTRLKEIRRQSNQKKRLLSELELEKEELQLMVRRLTESETDPMKLRLPISRYKGRLDWPARGSTLRRFGVYIDPDYNTKRRQNGVTLRMDKGTPVKAIYSGKVIYADWFKNYGNLVILDHRDRITSFYAHCDRLLVSKGDVVERGQVIAESGDTGSLDGPVLHFEIRNQTKPENPKEWLVRRRR
ncbi:Peptidoglycan DD-metalloendopeptidase family protein [Sulfidibacter corallicola]|uniref:Peptidoglycan DD-metalloendopeptidase family protein n=1 Tax=Sulfidibacter corallicola TaxID=2818388 RepID=A0A8A4TVN5_SULCO|nr:peptidoglycan DD-metalloendopeptidase family protein [Sulfidibacter corallicola]QTD53999.1 peptidoglycan DD-metalloendopeptidase family protein [Sulfidibacter corallicola]